MCHEWKGGKEKKGGQVEKKRRIELSCGSLVQNPEIAPVSQSRQQFAFRFRKETCNILQYTATQCNTMQQCHHMTVSWERVLSHPEYTLSILCIFWFLFYDSAREKEKDRDREIEGEREKEPGRERRKKEKIGREREGERGGGGGEGGGLGGVLETTTQ